MQFKSPEVQCIGSTAGCGCDFPHLMYQNGEWPAPLEEWKYPDQVAVEQRNREALVKLLREIREPTIELYGIWEGAEGDHLKTAKSKEVIALDQILNSNFYFKEQGFYLVNVESRVDILSEQLST